MPNFSILPLLLPVMHSLERLGETDQKQSRRRTLGSLTLILAVYLVLAFYGIDRQSLWEDEYNSVWRVTASTNPIWKDGHGFFYFALLYSWIQLGTSELMLRSLSVLLGAVAVCLTYSVGIALLDRRAAVYGTLIFASSPFLISYSQEVRYITLVLVTTLLAMYAFSRAVSQPALAWWSACGAASLLAFFSFLSTLMLAVVQGLYLLGSRFRRPLMRKWLVCQIVIFILFGWWFVNGTHFLRAFTDAKASGQPVLSNTNVFPFTGEFNKVTAAVIPYTFFALSPGFSLGPSPRELYADRSLGPLAPHIPLLVILAVLYGGLLFSGWMALRRRRDSRTFLLLWMVIPVFGVFGIAKALNIFYDVRYVAMILPAYALLLAAGIGRFRRRRLQLLLLGAILAVHGAALGNYYFDPRYAREDTRSAAQFLQSAAGSRDIVTVVGTSSSLPYYYKGNLPLVDFDISDEAVQPLSERLRELGANHERIWLVQIRPWQVDRAGNIKAALDGAHELVEQRHFPGVDIYAYRVSR